MVVDTLNHPGQVLHHHRYSIMNTLLIVQFVFEKIQLNYSKLI